MPQFGDGNHYAMFAKTQSTSLLRAVIDIGATGAPTANCDSGFTITRTGVGTYNITFPPIADYTKTLPVPEVGIVQSAARTVAGAVMTAFSPSNGTGTFNLYLATPGTPVEAANGDQIYFCLTAGMSGSR